MAKKLDLLENLGIVLIASSIFVLIYACIYPKTLGLFFDSILGRSILIVYLLAVTSCSPIFGIILLIGIIWIYNTKVFTGLNGLEGFENNISSKPQPKNTTSTIDDLKPQTVDKSKDSSEPIPEYADRPLLNNAKEKSGTITKPVDRTKKPFVRPESNTTREKMTNLESTMRPKSSHTLINTSGSNKQSNAKDPSAFDEKYNTHSSY